MARPKSPDALTPAERTARYRQAKRAAGGKTVPKIILSPEDSAKMTALEQRRGATPTEIVRQLIREAQ